MSDADAGAGVPCGVTGDPRRLLRSDRAQVEVLAAAASDWFRSRGLRIPQVTVVKDYWVTEVLRCLATPLVAERHDRNSPYVQARAVFKGGTSLSKAYGLLDRFSEDVDIYIDAYEVDATGRIVADGSRVGKSRVDSLMKMAARRVSETLGVTATDFDVQRAGSKRGYVLDYGAAPDSSRSLKHGVQLELVRMGHPTPSASRPLRSLLAEYVAQAGIFPLSEFDDMAPVTMDVLAPERTLVDKLCILHGQALKVLAREGYEMRRHARHYYDVYQLLNSGAVVMNLRAEPGMVARYAAEASAESDRHRRPGEPRPAEGFAASAAFVSPSVAEHARAMYEQEMAGLAYGEVPDFGQILSAVEGCASLL